jgi:hypothetical protein
MLERYAMKVARTVLRGGSGSNVTPLPDHADGWILTAKWLFRGFGFYPFHKLVSPASLRYRAILPDSERSYDPKIGHATIKDKFQFATQPSGE